MREAPHTERRFARFAVRALFAVACVCAMAIRPAMAHEVRPAYLELTESTARSFHVLLKTPMRGDLRLALEPAFSGRVEPISPVVSQIIDNALVQTWQVRAVDPLAGQQIRIEGLQSTMTDALVRLEFVDGRSWVQRLTPAQPSATVPAGQSRWQVTRTYFPLGIEHILLGIDHLLFVLGLMLLTTGARQIIGTITAFTLAHSLTLGAATLGLVHMPSRPIEAMIALSIVFVALEAIHARHGKLRMAARAPWLVAFTFGLLHGFGFAGTLTEIGMPEGHVPVALLFFNLGVEAGQLLFVAAVLTVVSLVRMGRVEMPRRAAFVPPYVIGSVAMFWVIQRVAAF